MNSPVISAVPDHSETYAVLDFETTGLSPGMGDRAIEIGISLFSDGVEIDTYSSLINPGMPINPFITGLTGISNKMVKSAPPANIVMREALEFVGCAHLVAHNASFDKKFWRHELEQELRYVDDKEYLCTLMLSRRVFQSFTSHKLGEITRGLSFGAFNSHRALADAQVTARILGVIIDRLKIAHPGKLIDADFLRKYQKRSKASLPDLTTERHAISAGVQTA